MQEQTRQPSDKARAISQALIKARHKMLLLKKYKGTPGTPVVVSENGKIKHFSADELFVKLPVTD